MLFKVRGNSMSPTLLDGDYVIGRRPSRRRPVRTGDVVIVDHRQFGRMVKRVCSIDADGAARVSGDNASSTSSVDIGLLTPSQVINLVLWRVSRNGVSRVVRAA
ncbi:MAG: S24/S26 family peptidase [Pseudomonadota bacterium]